MTTNPDTDPISVAGYRLHLLANEYEPGHPYGDVARALADSIQQDGMAGDHASREDARRRALALLGTPAPPRLDPLPEPGQVIPGSVAEQLPPGSVVYRDNVDAQFGRREHLPGGRWLPDLAADIPYRVAEIPAPRTPA